MKVTVTGRNVDVTPALRKYAEDKVGKFDKYLSKISEATVTFSIQKHLHKVDVLIRANGTILQAEGITEELYASIDEATSKLDKQVRRHKDKITSRRKGESGKGKGARAAAVQPAVDMAAEPSEGVIIERQSYEMKPMPPEEAVMQLEIDGLDFLVFSNSENGQIGVVYKRKDGNFGLIEPVAK
jgi:putative sigma-54 modulation protein